MSFGAPTALFWLALAVPIIGLYILKVRMRRVPVSTNLFWKQVYEEKPPRSLWRYLRHLLSLLLQLLMLALLALAVADPYLPWQLTQARRVVLVIDQSASMQATDVAPSRFAAALEAASVYVDGLRSRDEMAIVLAGTRPDVALGMTSHRPTLRRTLDVLEPTDDRTALLPAIDLAGKLIGDHPKGQIIVLTDGCDEGVEYQELSETSTSASNEEQAARDPQRSHVVRRVFATEAANIGITQFQVRRSFVDPLGYEILVEVKNASSSAMTCRLELELDGLPVDILPIELGPEEVWSRSLEKTSLEGGRVSGRLTEIALDRSPEAEGDSIPQPSSEDQASKNNHLQVDDIAWAILPAREIQSVLIVTPGNLFLQKVFEANPLVTVNVLNELPDTWPTETLIVLHQLVPDVMPSGDVFVVDPAESTDLWTLGETLANPIITEQDTDSALMTHVRLDNVLMPQARKLDPTGPARVLAGSVSNDPIYAELPRDDGRCLVLTVDLEESDLAFRTAFPIMASNALGWFAGTSGELNRSLATGDVTSVSVRIPSLETDPQVSLVPPEGEGEEELTVSVRSTDRNERDATVAASKQSVDIAVGPLERVGIYEIVCESARSDRGIYEEQLLLSSIAVNLANQRESDLRPPENVRDSEDDAGAVANWFSRPVWFYLTLLACVLTVTEWSLYHRRVIE